MGVGAYFFSLSLRKEIHSVSRRISSAQTLAAAPMPTHRAGDRVPDRSPRSWPPPENSGSRRTRGRRRTYSAPMPFGPYSCNESSVREVRHTDTDSRQIRGGGSSAPCGRIWRRCRCPSRLRPPASSPPSARCPSGRTPSPSCRSAMNSERQSAQLNTRCSRM